MFKSFRILPPLYFKLETNGYIWRINTTEIPTNIRYAFNWDRIREKIYDYRWQACRAAWSNYNRIQKKLKIDEKLNNNWYAETDGNEVFKSLIKKNQ